MRMRMRRGRSRVSRPRNRWGSVFPPNCLGHTCHPHAPRTLEENRTQRCRQPQPPALSPPLSSQKQVLCTPPGPVTHVTQSLLVTSQVSRPQPGHTDHHPAAQQLWRASLPSSLSVPTALIPTSPATDAHGARLRRLRCKRQLENFLSEADVSNLVRVSFSQDTHLSKLIALRCVLEICAFHYTNFTIYLQN